MILENHKVIYEKQDYQVHYSPKGRYYYIWKKTYNGEAYPVEIEYNRNETVHDTTS